MKISFNTSLLTTSTTTTKSKSKSLSTRRSSPCTRSKSLPESNPSKSLPESNPSPCTQPKALPRTNEIPRTPFSLGAITPIGTLKSVTLSDWWLTKRGKEKALSITGFESKGGSEMRLFSSGTIIERHNTTTLEAIDGITISINGFINRFRTLQNGISNEVCSSFLLGFPYNWKDYNGEEEEKKKDDDDVETEFSVLFDDVPVKRLNDLSFVEGCLKEKILIDVVGSLRDLVCPKSDKKRENDESLVSRVVVGVKTRGMRRREDMEEASIGKRVRTMSKKRR